MVPLRWFWELCSRGTSTSLAAVIRRLQKLPWIDIKRVSLKTIFPRNRKCHSLTFWKDCFSRLQRNEIKHRIDPWLRPHLEHSTSSPETDYLIRGSLSLDLAPRDISEDKRLCEFFTERMRFLLRDGNTFLCNPTTPFPAIKIRDALRDSTRSHNSEVFKFPFLASMANLPEVTMPLTKVGKMPQGLSLIGGYRHDAKLLEVVDRVCDDLQKNI